MVPDLLSREGLVLPHGGGGQLEKLTRRAYRPDADMVDTQVSWAPRGDPGVPPGLCGEVRGPRAVGRLEARGPSRHHALYLSPNGSSGPEMPGGPGWQMHGACGPHVQKRGMPPCEGASHATPAVWTNLGAGCP